jgi:hypothetical protein
MLIHAANDYSTAPGSALAEELAKAGRPCTLQVNPPFGRTAEDAQNIIYTDISEWEGDVFGFLDMHVKPISQPYPLRRLAVFAQILFCSKRSRQ